MCTSYLSASQSTWHRNACAITARGTYVKSLMICGAVSVDCNIPSTKNASSPICSSTSVLVFDITTVCVSLSQSTV